MSDRPETGPFEIPESHSASSIESNSQDIGPDSADDPNLGAAIATPTNASGPTDAAKAPEDASTSKPQPLKDEPVDPFDPMNLGISTDYAAAISSRASTKPFELRKPNDQEFFRTSPLDHQRLFVGGIADKQDMSKLYVVHPSVLEEVKVRFPKHLRSYELVLTVILVGTAILWGVPLSEDRGGRWHSSQRDGRHQGKLRWTNMASGRGQYDLTTIDNPKDVDWNSYPPMTEILRQALSEGRLIDSLDHPMLRKLRGEIE